jgi:hypothetical protein
MENGSRMQRRSVAAALHNHCTAVEVGLAGAAIALGVAVYLLDRGGAVAFVPRQWATVVPVRHVFGALGGSLPTFVHTFAFALLFTALLRPRASVAVAAICASWALVEAVFEIGQFRGAAVLLRSWAGAASDVAPVRAMLGYFASGTFSPSDLLSIALGGGLAYLVASRLRSGEH